MRTTPSTGYNPMRWDCEKQGCFNKLKRPKIEVFSDCFPGKISFGDMDGRVEINSRFLELEWKPDTGRLSTGQRILFERITTVAPVTVFVVAGDAETMEVEALAQYQNGKFYMWRPSTLGALQASMERWSKWAINQRRTKKNFGEKAG